MDFSNKSSVKSIIRGHHRPGLQGRRKTLKMMAGVVDPRAPFRPNLSNNQLINPENNKG